MYIGEHAVPSTVLWLGVDEGLLTQACDGLQPNPDVAVTKEAADVLLLRLKSSVKARKPHCKTRRYPKQTFFCFLTLSHEFLVSRKVLSKGMSRNLERTLRGTLKSKHFCSVIGRILLRNYRTWI